MAWLFAGILFAFGVYYFLRWTAHADPRAIKRAALAGAVALALVGVALILTGRIAVSWPFLLGSAATYLRYLRRRRGSAPTAPRSGSMTEEQALDILGLKSGASTADIRTAHRRLIQKLHPDQGGSTYLAAEINRAKDFLIALNRKSGR